MKTKIEIDYVTFKKYPDRKFYPHNGKLWLTGEKSAFLKHDATSLEIDVDPEVALKRSLRQKFGLFIVRRILRNKSFDKKFFGFMVNPDHSAEFFQIFTQGSEVRRHQGIYEIHPNSVYTDDYFDKFIIWRKGETKPLALVKDASSGTAELKDSIIKGKSIVESLKVQGSGSAIGKWTVILLLGVLVVAGAIWAVTKFF